MVSSLLQLKEVKSIKDFLGNELNIGDEVVALAHQRTSSTLYRGRISKFTKSMVVINTEGYDSDWRFSETMRVSPEKVVKISSNIQIQFQSSMCFVVLTEMIYGILIFGIKI